MPQNQMIAMILAGGRGTRLGKLTDKVAKPAVYFSGKYRIIDFPLSNCANSSIKIVGVLTQYESVFLNAYVAQDSRWGLDMRDGGVFVLTPRERTQGFDFYRGTADAITQNIDFIDQQEPEYILILSGDHVYKMNYAKMLAHHKQQKADATIAVLEVPLTEASRFGIMDVDQNDRIVEFEEKPKQPKSNLASMGIYIFTWKKLKQYLLSDQSDEQSTHDFGHDLIPRYLADGLTLSAYRFRGYWKDVGTLESLWEGNMDVLSREEIDIYDPTWRIYTEDVFNPPHYVSRNARIRQAMISQGCHVDGTVERSVLFHNVTIHPGATVVDSVLFPGVVVESQARIEHAIVAENVHISAYTQLVSGKDDPVQLISEDC